MRRVTISPSDYHDWRASRLGGLTEKVERELLWRLLGDPAGLLLLDVGCGDGAFTRQIAGRGARAVGLDADPGMLDVARQGSPSGAAEPWWVRGLAQRLPVRDACCDVVVAVTMLCFLADRQARQAMREMARVLKPGGRLILGELSPWSLWAVRRRVRGWLGSSLWRGARFHGPRELRSLVAGAGLEICALQGAVYYPPWWWAARHLTPWDRSFSKMTCLGAAFLALVAEKPLPDKASNAWRADHV